MSDVIFEETQRPPAWLTAAAVILITVPIVLLVAVAGSRDDAWRIAGPTVLAVLAWAVLRLRTRVTSDALVVRFFPFPSKVVPARDIARAEAVTYRPIRDYGGWGWRWTRRRGWAYTMHGNRGVMIHRKNDRSFLVGSQRAEELALTIERVLS